mmetsp:Transcript_32386/g.75497  ORF Transcript_32386/g.75497 Transcript_32386/m.75497 type:complete len:202 (+) Transcript_32386:1776-2381(+)
MRSDGAKLDEHRAHTRAQGDLERVRHAMPLEDRVHARLCARARGDRVEERDSPIRFVSAPIDRPPPPQHPAAQRRRRRRLGEEELRRFLCGDGAVPDAHLANVPLVKVLEHVGAVLGADEDRRHLVGELRRRLGGCDELAVDIQSHGRAVIRGAQLVPLVGRDGAGRDQVPRLHLAMEERAHLRVEPQPVLATQPRVVLAD